MYLEELSLINFRNLERQTVKFKRGNGFLGRDNAAGKTNLLEAIYLLSTAKSFRTRADHELIAWGQEQAKVFGKVGALALELSVKPESKQLSINKQPKNLTEIIGSFVTVLFTPSDIALVGGPPFERRRFLDHLASNLSKEYLLQLVSFNRSLRNRNQLLYQLKPQQEGDLWVWDQQLAKAASFVWEFRVGVIKELAEKLKSLGKKLLQASLTIDYPAPFGETTKARIQEAYLKTLQSARKQEIVKKQTLFGPHRDDFKLIQEEEKENKVVSKNLGIYGSRGEQRGAALALKLSEVEILESDKKIKPVLLLDEVLSELDEKHRQLLLRQVHTGQTFITTTSLVAVESVLGGNLNSFLVREGKLEPKK